jgi:hypothetical protein
MSEAKSGAGFAAYCPGFRYRSIRATSCTAFATAVKDDLQNVAKIKASLSVNSLLGDQFLQKFTVAPKKKKSK